MASRRQGGGICRAQRSATSSMRSAGEEVAHSSIVRILEAEVERRFGDNNEHSTIRYWKGDRRTGVWMVCYIGSWR
jgi:hypothetical protein